MIINLFHKESKTYRTITKVISIMKLDNNNVVVSHEDNGEYEREVIDLNHFYIGI